MERVKPLEIDGKNVISFDLSNIKDNADFISVIEQGKEVISRYEHNSVYAITNVKNITFDSETKKLFAEWMTFNKPFILKSAFYGVDGIKRIMMRSVLMLTSRSNVEMFYSENEAFEYLK